MGEALGVVDGGDDAHRLFGTRISKGILGWSLWGLVWAKAKLWEELTIVTDFWFVASSMFTVVLPSGDEEQIIVCSGFVRLFRIRE